MTNVFFAWLSVLANNLFYSVTSAKFYSKVYQDYSGAGLKYLAIIAMIASLIFSTSLLHVTTEFNNYFAKGTITNRTANLDGLLNQFPVLNYDGNKITAEENSPVFLYDSSNKKIVVIDPDGKLKPNELEGIPVQLSSHKLTFKVDWPLGGEKISAPVQYSALLGAKPETIDQEFIRTVLEETFASSTRTVIYAIFPMVSFSFFIGTISQNLLTIIFLVLLSLMQSGKFILAKNLRVVIFASAPFMLMQTIVATLIMFAILKPVAASYVKYAQIWTNLLMIIGIFQSFKNSKNKA